MKTYLITMLILFAIGVFSDDDDGKPSEHPGIVKLVQTLMLAWTIYRLCQL